MDEWYSRFLQPDDVFMDYDPSVNLEAENLSNKMQLMGDKVFGEVNFESTPKRHFINMQIEISDRQLAWEILSLIGLILYHADPEDEYD